MNIWVRHIKVRQMQTTRAIGLTDRGNAAQVARLPAINEAAAATAAQHSAARHGQDGGPQLARDASRRDLMRLWATPGTSGQPKGNGGAGGSEHAASQVATNASAAKAAAAMPQRPGVPGLLYTSPERTKLASQSPGNSRTPAANLFGSALPQRQ